MISKYEPEQLQFALPKGRKARIYILTFPTKTNTFRAMFFRMGKAGNLKNVTAPVCAALQVRFDKRMETAVLPFPRDNHWTPNDYPLHKSLMMRLGVAVWNNPTVFEPMPVEQ